MHIFGLGVWCVMNARRNSEGNVLAHAVKSENEVTQGVHTWEEKAGNMFFGEHDRNESYT